MVQSLVLEQAYLLDLGFEKQWVLALGTGDEMTPENIAAGWDSVSDMDDARELFSGPEQTIKILEQADKS